MSPTEATSVAERRGRIRKMSREGHEPRAIAAELAVSRRTVEATLAEPETRLERDLADVRWGWAPDCMDAPDWIDWQRMNPANVGGGKALKPCWDCPVGFAAEMRAEGRCNGTPGWQPPADDHEEAHVGDTVTVSSVTVSAPCGSCAHTAVCAIKASLRGLEEADVAIPKPDPALTIGLAVTVECSHYLRAKGSPTGRKLNLSDDERARRGARLTDINAQRAADKAGS